MTDKAQRNPGVLTLITDTNTKEMNLLVSIPAQTMYLRSYRVEMTSAGAAKAARILYLDIPNIYNGHRVIDNNVGRVFLPIFLDDASVTHVYGKQIPISMTNSLPERFTIRVLDSTFALAADLESAAFEFSLEYGTSS